MPAVGPREPFSFPLLEAKGRELGGFDARDQRGLLGRAQKIGGAREAGKLRRAEQVDLRGLGRSGAGGFRRGDASRSMREARSEEDKSELKSLMGTSYAVCW